MYFENGARISRDISPKKIYEWPKYGGLQKFMKYIYIKKNEFISNI